MRGSVKANTVKWKTFVNPVSKRQKDARLHVAERCILKLSWHRTNRICSRRQHHLRSPPSPYKLFHSNTMKKFNADGVPVNTNANVLMFTDHFCVFGPPKLIFPIKSSLPALGSHHSQDLSQNVGLPYSFVVCTHNGMAAVERVSRSHLLY